MVKIEYTSRIRNRLKKINFPENSGSLKGIKRLIKVPAPHQPAARVKALRAIAGAA
jgi:hypothetical protein